MRRIGGQRRKHILDLVEQERNTWAATQEYLADLQRSVAVASGLVTTTW
jgi:hypothetical protein